MGAERWLDFGRKEVSDKVQAYLFETDSIVLESGDGVWLDWTSRNKLEVGYSFGGYSSEIATLVCRELAKRFKVKKVGADSVGWYKDKDWADCSAEIYGRYPGATSWVDWQEKYQIDWSPLVTMAAKYGRAAELEEYVNDLRPLDVAVVERFVALDKALENR